MGAGTIGHIKKDIGVPFYQIVFKKFQIYLERCPIVPMYFSMCPIVPRPNYELRQDWLAEMAC